MRRFPNIRYTMDNFYKNAESEEEKAPKTEAEKAEIYVEYRDGKYVPIVEDKPINTREEFIHKRDKVRLQLVTQEDLRVLREEMENDIPARVKKVRHIPVALKISLENDKVFVDESTSQKITEDFIAIENFNPDKTSLKLYSVIAVQPDSTDGFIEMHCFPMIDGSKIRILYYCDGNTKYLDGRINGILELIEFL